MYLIQLVLVASPRLVHCKDESGGGGAVTGVRDGDLLALGDVPLRDEHSGAPVDVSACVGHARVVRHGEGGMQEDGVEAEVRVMDIEHVREELFRFP